MNISEGFIRRPIATSLLMAAIALFGAVAYRSLPVSDLPNVDFPTLLVTATLPGASPETMGASVATPLENQFSTIAGLDSMTSVNSLGSTQITLEFDLNRSIDGAAVDVQATGQLANADEFKRVIVTYRGSAPVRLEEVASVVDGPEDPHTASWFYTHGDQQRAITLGIQRQPGTNTIAVADAVKNLMPVFQAELPASVHMD